MSLNLKAVILLAWLLSPVMSAQITPALGRLRITSMPRGANITINGRMRPELTDVTLVVAPGQYAVSISGGPGKLNCSKRVQVSRGQTVEVTCS